MEHYFFSYLLTWEVDLIEILEIMAQMWQYVIFLSLKPTKVTPDFILYYTANISAVKITVFRCVPFTAVFSLYFYKIQQKV